MKDFVSRGHDPRKNLNNDSDTSDKSFQGTKSVVAMKKSKQPTTNNRSNNQVQAKNNENEGEKEGEGVQLKEDPIASFFALHAQKESQQNSSPNVAQAKLEDDESLQMKKDEDEEILQRKSSEEEEPLQAKKGEDEEIQMKASSSSTKTKMPEGVQSKMENSFGTDFSNVNIHSNSDNASNIGALAYTQGQDIHFAPGQYSPDSQSGQELLGHELTHVVQQSQGNVQPTTQMKGVGINDDKGLEKEADDMGKMAAQGKMISSVSSLTSPSIQRKAMFDFFNHKVLENETLLQIAIDYNVPLDKILELNSFKAEQVIAPGTIIKVPNPEKIKEENPTAEKKDKPKSKEEDRLGLVNQENQYLKVTATDFQNFLNLYNKFSLPEIDKQGNVKPQEIKDPKELADLKYLLGPIQNQNPEIKKFLDEAEKYVKSKGEKVKEALTPTKAIKFVEKLWKSGFLGKIAIIIPAAAAAGGAGYLRYKSVQLTLAGNGGTAGKANELINQLLDQVLFDKDIDLIENKDLNGKVTDKPVQEEFGFNLTNKEKFQFGASVSSTTSFNKEINESNRNDWKDAKFDDKTIWYSMSNKDYYDSITLRHYIHQATDHKLSNDSQIINSSSITSVDSLMKQGSEAPDTKFIFLKDLKVYTYSQIVALVASGSIDRNSPLARETDIKKVSDVDLLAAAKLYGDEYMTLGANAYGGVGLNNNFSPLNYQFGADLTLTFPFKKSSPYFKVGYSQDKHYDMLGHGLNQWTEVFMSELLLKAGANYKFDMGDFHASVGGDASYKQTYQSTTSPSGSSVVKDEHMFSINPYFRVNYDKNNQTISFDISPEFIYQDDKFKAALNLGVSGLKLGNNSYIKVNFKIKDNKLDTANLSLFYHF